MLEWISNSPEETWDLGARFAAEYLDQGAVVALFGDLGAGKTQFVKGIASTLGIDGRELTSPTFALANEYPCRLPDGSETTLFHLDCYRFEKPEELLELGIEDYLQPQYAMTVVEWPERIKKYLPETTITLRFLVLEDDSRLITLELPNE